MDRYHATHAPEMALGAIAAILAALAVACGGQADWLPGDAPDAGAPPTDAAPESARVPLCPGAVPPEPGDCQTLVYDPSSGYCNLWSVCP